MTENALAIPSSQSKYVSTEVEKAFATASYSFLPYIQVAGGSSKIVKERKIGIGQIALIEGKNVLDLGTQITALIMGWRPKAVRFGNDIVTAYNPENELFKEIRDGALQGGQNNPNTFGPEFLLWLPDFKKIVLFYHGNTTLRNEATLGIKIFNDQQAKQGWIPVEFKIDYVEDKQKRSWYTTRISNWNSEVPADKMPDPAVMVKEIERFNNPKEELKEKAEGDTSRD